MRSDGCTVRVGEKEVAFEVSFTSHMMDMKAANLYLGLGGGIL